MRTLVIALFVIASQQSPEQMVQQMRRSHIDANVPAPTDFDRLLARDLATYFQELRKERALAIEFELLRDGPTQSGISYPKFYAWCVSRAEVRLRIGAPSD